MPGKYLCVLGWELACSNLASWLFIQRPEKLNDKPSVLPAVEVIAPGGSYNPDFFSHQVNSTSTTSSNVSTDLSLFSAASPTLWSQALLQEAHDVEVKKQKEDLKTEKQLAFNKEDKATEVHAWS